MSDYPLSQTVPVSSLPRNYLSLIKNSQERGEPIILLRHSKPIGALVSKRVLDKLMQTQMKMEEREALDLVKKGNHEFRHGETVSKLP